MNPTRQNFFWLAKRSLRLVLASYSLLKRQALKLTFFAPCGVLTG